ncbi:hypothetical protein [Azorhizobium sp. AG788]|uniref:hypothetical protein n=1 Tax=Azorhizobium sp. AG788 TaxID=2183897 RepID=UPI00313A1B0F
MSKAYAGRFSLDATMRPDGEDLVPASTRWGFPPNAEPSRSYRASRLSATPPEPGDRPVDGEVELDQLAAAMREANGQPLPGALPTMRFWVVILAAMTVLAASAALTVL